MSSEDGGPGAPPAEVWLIVNCLGTVVSSRYEASAARKCADAYAEGSYPPYRAVRYVMAESEASREQ